MSENVMFLSVFELFNFWIKSAQTQTVSLIEILAVWFYSAG